MNRQEIFKNYFEKTWRLSIFKILYPNSRLKPRENHNSKVRIYTGILNRRKIAMMPRAPTSQAMVNNFQRRVAQLKINSGNIPVRRENNPIYVAPSQPKRRSPPKSRSPSKYGCLGGLCRKLKKKWNSKNSVPRPAI